MEINKQNEIRNCISCGIEIPIQRIKILPKTKVCVKCSDITKKGGTTIMKGTGEDTWNEIVILEGEEYKKFIEEERKKLDNNV
jgi:hypothetical protein